MMWKGGEKGASSVSTSSLDRGSESRGPSPTHVAKCEVNSTFIYEFLFDPLPYDINNWPFCSSKIVQRYGVQISRSKNCPLYQAIIRINDIRIDDKVKRRRQHLSWHPIVQTSTSHQQEDLMGSWLPRGNGRQFLAPVVESRHLVLLKTHRIKELKHVKVSDCIRNRDFKKAHKWIIFLIFSVT
ncbi:hypothetical protein TNCV_3240011 [Trichonephila clavipes]|nr:hypothetical protein TNCV_3240011 [Trichonephila clavipes]